MDAKLYRFIHLAHVRMYFISFSLQLARGDTDEYTLLSCYSYLTMTNL
jgi:hypothetical protein